jgi:hypothetical protein
VRSNDDVAAVSQDIYNSASHLLSLCCPSLSPQHTNQRHLNNTHHTTPADIPSQPHHQPHSKHTSTASSNPDFTPSPPTNFCPSTTSRVDSIYKCSRYPRGLRSTPYTSHHRFSQNGMAAPIPTLAPPFASPHPSSGEGRACASRLPRQRCLSRSDSTSRTLGADNAWLTSSLASAAPSVPRMARRSG